MLVLVLSGAKRHIGKTYVAKKLAAALPSSIYAKLGQSKKTAGKQPNYFTCETALYSFLTVSSAIYKHAVVESNTWDFPQWPALRIFIGSREGAEDNRDDAESLRAIADIKVEKGAREEEWAEALLRFCPGGEIISIVTAVLAAQKRRLFTTGLSAHSKVWIVAPGGEHVFGPGIAEILAEVEHLGSLKAAAMACSMSYRHAWGLIKSAENNLGLKLLASSPGGLSGGQSLITEEAKKALAKFGLLENRISEFADAEFSRLYESGGGAGGG